MLRGVIEHVGVADPQDDGTYELDFDWMGDALPLFEGQRLGALILAEGMGLSMLIDVAAFDSDGVALGETQRKRLRMRGGFPYFIALLPKHFETRATLTVRITPVKKPDDVVEVSVETYPGVWGLFGSGVPNLLPHAPAINALEKQTGQKLCADHLRFLKTQNGLNWTWWQHSEWRKISNEAETDRFYDALSQAEEAQPDLGLLSDATYLFGVGPGQPDISYPDNLGDIGFYDLAFLRFGIPVGVDAGGNLFVQILGGTRRGEIVFLDHEYHYGMLDDADPPQLADDIREGAPDKPLEQFSADEFWAHMDRVGYAIHAAGSLDEMITRLDAHHRGLMAKMRVALNKP